MAVTKWIPRHNVQGIPIKSNSWFDINKIKNPNKTNHNHYDEFNNQEFIRSHEIYLFPNEQQKIILDDWWPHSNIRRVAA